MAKTDAEIQRELEEKKLKAGLAEAEAEVVGARRVILEAPEEELEEESAMEEVMFAPTQPTGAYSKDWPAILADYTNKFNKKPDESGTLIFPTQDDAVNFFEAQAKAERKFCAVEVVDGKRIDNYMFSCGEGKLYKGSAADIKSQLAADLKKDPNNSNLREGLDVFKKMAPEPKPAAQAAIKDTLNAGRADQVAKQRAAADEQTADAAITGAPTPSVGNK